MIDHAKVAYPSPILRFNCVHGRYGILFCKGKFTLCLFYPLPSSLPPQPPLPIQQLHAAYEDFLINIARIIPVIRVNYDEFHGAEEMAAMVLKYVNKCVCVDILYVYVYLYFCILYVYIYIYILIIYSKYLIMLLGSMRL